MPSSPSLPPMDSLVRFIRERLAKRADLGDGAGSFTALSETAERFNDTSWFWVDDNAKAAELLALPALYRQDSSLLDATIDFVLRLSEGPVIRRRCGPAEIAVDAADPCAFRVRTAFFNVTGDLSRGVVRQSVRFNDGRTMDAVHLTGNLVECRVGGRAHVLDVEDAITGFALTRDGDEVHLMHESLLHARCGPLRRRTPVATVRYEYAVSAHRAAIGLRVTLAALRGVILDDVVITTACDQLGALLAAQYRAVVIGTAGAWRTQRALPTGGSVAHEGAADYLGLLQEGGSPGFAYAIHARMHDPARVASVCANGVEDGRLHWVLTRYRIGRVAAGERVSIAEDRLLTAGGYYDAPGHYAAVMRDADGGGTLDPSMTYDIGAELNAVAVHLLFAAAGHYAVASERVATLRAWYDRHLDRYFDHVGPGRPGCHDRVFSRGLAFVVLSLDCMLRATGEERYRALMETGTGLLLGLLDRAERPGGGWVANVQDRWCDAPFLDCQGAALLAVCRAALHGDADGCLAAAAREMLAAIQLGTVTVAPAPGESVTCDSLLVRRHGAGPEDTGYWNFKLGLTLRGLRMLTLADARGAVPLAVPERRRVALLQEVCVQLIEASSREHDGALEVLTSQRAGETNSETQPWVILGLYGELDELVADIDVALRPMVETHRMVG